MSERVWKSPSERKWKRCLEGPSLSFTDRWSGLVFSLREATLSAGHRAAASRGVELNPCRRSRSNAKRSLSSHSLLYVQVHSDLPTRLPADALMCSLAAALSFLRTLISKEKKKLKKKKKKIGATNQRQLRHEISAKSSIADFCFSSKSRHFLLWRNTSDSLAKRPQSREVLRPGSFFTHYTKIVGCFGTNTAA